MEKFKAVEKAMKTKAYSKEGLSAAAKLDPKERAKLEACEFLSNMVDELERQIETLEAEGETIQATMKKGKSQGAKADRMAEIERITEKHKWHQGKLELIKRSLENGGVETEQVTDLEESIRYYISDGMTEDYVEDDEMYDDLNLEEDEDMYGMNNENDRLSSQDTQSVQEDAPDAEGRSGSIPGAKSKSVSVPEPPVAAARRPSTQLKSPLPALATLHTPLNLSNGSSSGSMKPAAVPIRPPGETLKYASAAAAAAASVGIAPLPPPPGATPPSNTNTPLAPLPPPPKPSIESPIVAVAQPVSAVNTPAQRPSVPAQPSVPEPVPSNTTQSKSPILSQASTTIGEIIESSVAPTSAVERADNSRSAGPRVPATTATSSSATSQSTSGLPYLSTHSVLIIDHVVVPAPKPNGVPNGFGKDTVEEEDESIYHLPSSLQELMESFAMTKKRASFVPSPSAQRMLNSSHSDCPTGADAEQPRLYKPKYRFNTPSHYPQETLPTFDEPRLYSRVDPDTLFYVFYYKQGTYQQYLAAKSLKDQSWRFHKQYQTWFQRHEEPKTITEEFEQGTYRFFDYESTW
jgi:CCR4-NOT transcription complex subunit 3